MESLMIKQEKKREHTHMVRVWGTKEFGEKLGTLFTHTHTKKINVSKHS